MVAKIKRCDIYFDVSCVVTVLKTRHFGPCHDQKRCAVVLDVDTTVKLFSYVNVDALTVTKITRHLNNQLDL